MNYVVFDLEWNQCPRGKEYENKRLPFEIIEIGAVRLDDARAETDRFHAIIRPRVYRRLHYRTRRVVRLDNEALREGETFPDVAREFLAWAGPDARFCTWGGADLTELQRNLRFYQMLDLLPGPFYYYDVQKLFAMMEPGAQGRCSLERAIDLLCMEKSREFHSALADAVYTARVFAKIEMPLLAGNESVDFFQNPQSKTEEIYLAHRDDSQYISREFPSAEQAMQDLEVRRIHCYRCGRHARKKTLWFASGQHRHQCVAVCPEHGLLEGIIHIRRSESGAVFVDKCVQSCTEEHAEQIRARKKVMTERRRRRRRGAAAT